MFCPKCGTVLEEGAVFCGNCGSQLDAVDTAVETVADTVVQQPKQTTGGIAGDKIASLLASLQQMDLRKLIILAAALVVVVIAVVVTVNIITPDKYVYTKGTVYISQGEDSVVVIPHGKATTRVDGTLVNSARSLDGTVAVMLVNEDNNYSSDGYALYLVTDTSRLVSDGVHSYWLAASGDAVAYTKERDTNEGTEELWLYTGGNNTRISRAFSVNYRRCAISPDGKTLAFVTVDGDRHTGVVWDGQTHNINRDSWPIAIANGARYVYYVRDDVLFVQRGTSGDNRERLGESVSSLHFNRDYSQVVYAADGRDYLSVRGGRGERLSGRVQRFLMPHGAATQALSFGTVYGISAFADSFYINQDSAVVYLDSKLETNSVARNAEGVTLARDGKTILFLRNRSIYTVNGKNSNAEPTEIVDERVAQFIATADGKAVFFINSNDEIYHQKGKGRPTQVADFFSTRNISGLGYGLFKGNSLFYISDEELYQSSGNRGERVRGIEGRVQSVSAGMFSVTVTAVDGRDTLYYRSTDGSRFELVRQE